MILNTATKCSDELKKKLVDALLEQMTAQQKDAYIRQVIYNQFHGLDDNGLRKEASAHNIELWL